MGSKIAASKKPERASSMPSRKTCGLPADGGADSHCSMAWQLSQASKTKKAPVANSSQGTKSVWDLDQAGRTQAVVKRRPTSNSFNGKASGERADGRSASLLREWTRVK